VEKRPDNTIFISFLNILKIFKKALSMKNLFNMKITFKKIFLLILFLSINLGYSNSIKLLENDFLVPLGKEVCFSYFSTCNINEIYINGINVFNESNRNICISNLKEGRYEIKISCENTYVNFFVDIINKECEKDESIGFNFTTKENISQYEEFDPKISIKNNYCKGKIFLLRIFVNNESIEELRIKLLPNETKNLSERIIFTKEGYNVLRFEIENQTFEKNIYVKNREISYFPILFLIFIIIFLFSFRNFSSFHIIVSILFSLIIIFGFFIDFISHLFSNIFSLILFSSLLLTLKEKNKIKSEALNKIDLKIFFASFVTIFLFLLPLKIIPPTQNTYWNVFYERQVRETFYNNNVPKLDELSYLGREMSYPKGYFLLKSYLLWLFNLGYNSISDLILELVFNIFLIFSLVHLSKYLSKNFYSRFLFVLSFCSFPFVFTLLSAHLLHIPSLLLLFYSLAFALRKNIFLSSIMLFSSSLIHPYSIILYSIFIFSFLLIKKIKFDWRLFLPILIAYLPFFGLEYSSKTVALPEKWGWFLKGEFQGIFQEFSFVLLAVLFIILFNLKNRKNILFSISTIILIFVYAFISFRVNLIIFFFSSLLILDFLENAKFKESNKSLAILFSLLLIFANFIYSLYTLSQTFNLGGYIDFYTLDAIFNLGSKGDYVKSCLSVASDPFLGHAIAFISGKKVLADLYVEYADEEKLRKAEEFFVTENFSLIENYNISLTIIKNNCQNWNTIYDNRFYKICENIK